MVEKLLRFVHGALPLLFAFGFLVPVIMQGMGATGMTAPFGMSPLLFAVIIGGGWGVVAQVRGRWV